MFKFNMSIEDNFALFKNDKKIIIVDSFDNKTFDVRFGTITKSKKVGEIVAKNSEELNNQLQRLALTLF